MKLAIPLISGGALVVAIFSVLGFGGLDLIIETGLSNMLVLTKGTHVWDLWRTMPLPILIKFHFFSIQNPVEFATGAKAILREMGPYTYLEDWEKVDLTTNDEDDTVRYRMTKTYFFQPQLSNGTEKDNVTMINAVFLVTASMAHEFIEDEFMLIQMDDMLKDKGETLTKTATVRDILFDGISLKAYIDLFNNPVVQDLAKDLGLPGLPENVRDGKFAVFKGKNGTDDGFFVVKNGLRGSEEVGRIVSYNGQKMLDKWRGDSCNTINGSDGTFFPPFVTKDRVMHIFAPAMCRSFALHYHEESMARGVETYRYIATLKNWMAPKSNPDNWCFCPKKKNETGSCEDDGIFNIGPCVYGAPLLLSQPHFLGAEEWIQNGVIGLKPEFDKHMTILDFHPLTGSPVEAAGRMQFSIELIPYEDMASFADAHHAIIPMAWLEEGSGLDGEELLGLKMLDGLRNGFAYARFVFIAFGLMMMGVGVVISKRNRKSTTPIRKGGGGGTEADGAGKVDQGPRPDFTYT